MSKSSVAFVCRECGGESIRWSGQCPHCRAWNTMEEFRAPRGTSREARGGARPVPITEVDVDAAPRLALAWEELNRALGGGIVPGSLVLLGGEPGVGKSTLVMQAAAHFANAVGPVLYASGEESEHQIKSRGDRLGVGAAPLYLLSETCIERILEEMARLRPALVIIDSIQTVFSIKFQSAPGSIGQVREAA